MMRTFNYSKFREDKWDSELLGLVAAIYKEARKQEVYLKLRSEELEKLIEVECFRIQKNSSVLAKVSQS